MILWYVIFSVEKVKVKVMGNGHEKLNYDCLWYKKPSVHRCSGEVNIEALSSLQCLCFLIIGAINISFKCRYETLAVATDADTKQDSDQQSKSSGKRLTVRFLKIESVTVSSVNLFYLWI